MKDDWKENDWCLCEFKIQQIKRVENGQIREVSDGYFCHSGPSLNDRCYQLSLAGKNISSFYEEQRSLLHEKGGNGLNFPDIHRYFVNHWCETMNNLEFKDKTEEQLGEISNFVRDLLDRVDECKKVKVSGIRVFR